MCHKFSFLSAKSTRGAGGLALAALLLVLAGTTPAWALPNPSIGGVDANQVRANAQQTVTDSQGDVFGTGGACPNPVNYGFDYGDVSVWYDQASGDLYFNVNTFGNIGDSDQDGGYDTKGSTCGGHPGCVNIEADPFHNVFAAQTEAVTISVDRDCDGVADLLVTLSGSTTTRADSLTVTIDQLPGHASLTGSILGGRGVGWNGDPVQPGPDVVCVANRQGAILFKFGGWKKYFTDSGTVGGNILPGVSPTLFDWVVGSGNNSDQYTEDVVQGSFDISNPALDIAKVGDPSSLCAIGSTTTFTVTASNTGNTPLSGVVVTDLLPPGLSYVNGSGNPIPTSVVGQLITWDGGQSMQPGGSKTFTFLAAKTADCQGTVTDTARVVGVFDPACYVNHGLPGSTLSAQATFDVVCVSPCVDIQGTNQSTCAGLTLNVPFTVINCSTLAEDITVAVAVNGVPQQPQTFLNVSAGGTRNFTVPVSSPNAVPIPVTATASAAATGFQGCTATATATATATFTPLPPCDISGDQTACVGATKTYTTTAGANFTRTWSLITNPAGIANIVGPANGSSVQVNFTAAGTVTVQLDVADPADPANCYSPCTLNVTSEPVPTCTISGPTGVCANASNVTYTATSDVPGATFLWTISGNGTIAGSNTDPTVQVTAGASGSFILTVTVTGDACNNSCPLTVGINPCDQQLCCWLTGGGCLNENTKKGHKNHTFGGNVGPPPSGSWEHIVRDGKAIIFNFHSWDARVDSCWMDTGTGPCHPAADANNISWSGTGLYNLGSGSRDLPATFTAHVEDRGEPGNHQGPCGGRDFYTITVYNVNGSVAFHAEGYLDCGNMQIHKCHGDKGVTPSLARKSAGEAIDALAPANPNPFHSSTRISFMVSGETSQPVELNVYDVSGRLVRRLDSGLRYPGQYQVQWDGRDDSGATVAGGMYFVQIQAGDTRSVQRVMLVK